jgi:hypothetical protein
MSDNTYETLVYRQQGGDELVIQSAGILEVAEENVTGLDLRKTLVSNQGIVDIEPAAAATVLPTKNLPANAKVVTIYPNSTVVSASFWLTSCSAGREVHLHMRGDATGTFTNASTQVDVSCSGCILLGSVGDAISGFEMHTSLASDCGVHLVAVADNVWAIASQFGDIDE